MVWRMDLDDLVLRRHLPELRTNGSVRRIRTSAGFNGFRDTVRARQPAGAGRDIAATRLIGGAETLDSAGCEYHDAKEHSVMPSTGSAWQRVVLER
jgi:hypothetical protein